MVLQNGGLCEFLERTWRTLLACATSLRVLVNEVGDYLPTDFKAEPLFSMPAPVPKAIFLPVHFRPRPVAFRPLYVTLPVAVPVLATAVLAAPPAVLMSCPAPAWPKAAETGTIKQIARKMFRLRRMVLL